MHSTRIPELEYTLNALLFRSKNYTQVYVSGAHGSIHVLYMIIKNYICLPIVRGSTTEQTSIDIYILVEGDLLPTIGLDSNGRLRNPLGMRATVTRIIKNLVCIVKSVIYPH